MYILSLGCLIDCTGINIYLLLTTATIISLFTIATGNALKKMSGYWVLNILILTATPYFYTVMDCGMVPLIKNYIAYSIIAISLLSITPIAYKRYIFRRYRVERFYDTEGFLRSISIKNSRIFIVDSALPKAFTIGKDVFITSGMVELLDDEELKAVIAHEAFHIRQNRYPLINTFRFVTFIPFSFELLADRYAKNFAGERALNNAKRKLVDFYSS